VSPAFTLTSPETGTDYRIYVEAPPASSRDPMPAVLFMDGDDQFKFALAAYRELRAANLVAPLLLVGVGYGASYTKPANRRGRDYTPVAHADEPSSGGAGAFLRFLTATLWPELGRRFPVDDARRGLAGHSLGSLLVLHALFQPQPFFTHHLASAPSIWWADRALLGHAKTLRRSVSTLPARLFLCVGENDTPSMTGDLALLERQLAEAPFQQLAVTSRRFADRDHYNVLPDAFRTGLATLFGQA
jgi:predicted alpha/beta superfamily hydrolase